MGSIALDIFNRNFILSDNVISSEEPKKRKKVVYKVEKEVEAMIKDDEPNARLWAEALTHTDEGKMVRVVSQHKLNGGLVWVEYFSYSHYRTLLWVSNFD